MQFYMPLLFGLPRHLLMLGHLLLIVLPVLLIVCNINGLIGDVSPTTSMDAAVSTTTPSPSGMFSVFNDGLLPVSIFPSSALTSASSTSWSWT